jgi:succinyl-diaminopimelate desuccinylase
LNKVIEYTRELIARPSLTPDDAGCQDWLAERLAPLGFSQEWVRSGGVTNLWARRGSVAPVVCFAGHTDVVPTGPVERWSYDPFTPTLSDDCLYGRGAADMKGSIAAFLVAVEDFVAAHPDHPGSIAWLITSDEEGPAVDGTVKVVERLAARGERIDYCIVGEPTCASARRHPEERPPRLAPWSLAHPRHTRSHRLSATGEKPHPPGRPGDRRTGRHRMGRRNEYFPPTTWQISNIHGGTGATNVIPGHVDIVFNFRFSTASTVEGLKAHVHHLLDRHGIQYDLDWELGAKPYLTPRGRLVEALTAAIEGHTGITPQLSTTGGTSDGRFIADIAREVVEFGPVNKTIHKIDECVGVEELNRLVAIYRATLERLLDVR